MKPDHRSFVLRLVFSVVLGLMIASHASSGTVNLDDLADQLRRGITKESLRSVTIADFSATDGSPSDLGWYLANRLSDSWLGRHQKVRVVDRTELNTKVSADDLRSAEGLKRLGSLWGVESIVTGMVDFLQEGYVVTASVRRVSNGAVVLTATQSISRSRILDLLNPQGLDIGGAAAVPAGINGVGVPVCLKCPIPQYPDKAVKAKVHANVVLSVVISANGRTAKIAVVRDPGYGLTDAAIDNVSEWEFKPATDQDGKAVPIKLPVEVTFRAPPS